MGFSKEPFLKLSFYDNEMFLFFSFNSKQIMKFNAFIDPRLELLFVTIPGSGCVLC